MFIKFTTTDTKIIAEVSKRDFLNYATYIENVGI